MPNFDKPRGLTRRLRLTPAVIAKEIRAARAGIERITLVDTDCAGLRLVIGPRTASWSVTGQPRGIDASGKRHPLKSVTIGDAREIDPEAARKAAAAIKREVALGRDPVAERRELRRQEVLSAQKLAGKANADLEMLKRVLGPQPPPKGGNSAVAILNFTVLANATLEDCAKAFILHGVTGGRLHAYQTSSNLRMALREMGAADLKPSELDKRHVRALVELHAKAGRPATARHRHSAVDRLYKWLQAVDAIENNPASRIPVPPPPSPRSHVPPPQAVQALWRAAGHFPAPRAALIKLALLLPLRRQELANLKRANIRIDGGGMEIKLQPDQTKNRQAFTMPLVGAAADIVAKLLERGGSPDDALLPLASRGKIYSNWSRFSDQIEQTADLHFNWHDTRRMFASELAEHGVAHFGIIDGLLNHARSASLGGTARAYHHASEKAIRRDAMIAWDRILLHAVEHGLWPRQVEAASGNVVPLANRIP